MDKEKFFNACEGLYKSILAKTEKLSKEKIDGIDMTDFMLLNSVDTIVSEFDMSVYKGEQNEIPEIFEKVFEEARSIKANSYQVSHNKRLMLDNLDKKDDNGLAEAANSFIISHKLLLGNYKRALLAISEALKLRDKKEL